MTFQLYSGTIALVTKLTPKVSGRLGIANHYLEVEETVSNSATVGRTVCYNKYKK